MMRVIDAIRAILMTLIVFVVMSFMLLAFKSNESKKVIYVTNTVEVIQWRTNTTFVPGYYPNPYTPENGYTTTNIEVREWFSGMSSNDMATLRNLSPEALEAYWNSLTPEQKLDAR
jgi:hypothetical protein